MSIEATDLFDEPDLPRMHSRDYVVRAYRRDDETILVRGAVRDVLPAGFYDHEDSEPLTMHHMVVDLVVHAETLEIVEAGAVFEQHPHPACPQIAPHYGNLVGLSVARGFTHKIRGLFGGPRGCSHTTALLQAMAPVVMQAHLGRRMTERTTGQTTVFGRNLSAPEMRARRVEGNRNTCHIWAEDGEHVRRILDTGAVMLPTPIAVRLRARGIDPDEWTDALASLPDEV